MAENVEDAGTLVDEVVRVLEKIGLSNTSGGGDNASGIAAVLECLVAALKAIDMLPSEVASIPRPCAWAIVDGIRHMCMKHCPKWIPAMCAMWATSEGVSL